MANAYVDFLELRFVIESEETHVYVFLQATGDAPHTVQGWHHKAFPHDVPVSRIVQIMFAPGEKGELNDPMLWPQKVPPVKPDAERYTPDPEAAMKTLNRMLAGEKPEDILREILGPDAKITAGPNGISFEVARKPG